MRVLSSDKWRQVGAPHLEEQLACVTLPSLTSACFIKMEHTLGTYLKSLVVEQLLSAGREERRNSNIRKKILMISLPLLL